MTWRCTTAVGGTSRRDGAAPRAVFLGIGMGLLLGCQARDPQAAATAGSAAREPTAAEAEAARVAVRRASLLHRGAIDKLLGKGHALVDTCGAGTPDGLRLTVSPARHGSAMFVLDLAADAKGAVATWHAFRWDDDAQRFVALPVQGVRLDGNGWRQARQLVLDPRFLRLAPVDAGGLNVETWVLESCTHGRYGFVQRTAPRDANDPFVRAARGIVALAGEACELPGEEEVMDEHLLSVPPC